MLLLLEDRGHCVAGRNKYLTSLRSRCCVNIHRCVLPAGKEPARVDALDHVRSARREKEAAAAERCTADPFGYIQNMQNTGASLGCTPTKAHADRGDKGRPPRSFGTWSAGWAVVAEERAAGGGEWTK